jgi:hypothetical protein
MKPFKAQTKNGDKWYVLNGNSLVEVDAADVPGIVARMEEAEREEAEREEAVAALAKERSDCEEDLLRYTGGVFGNRPASGHWLDAMHRWLD